MNAPVPNLTEPVFGNIPMHLVMPSKTNPRKRFDQTYLEELAVSIKEHGVASPITVRPLPDTEDQVNCVEIVFGECRWRASQIAGKETIPALVRHLTDEEVIVLQVIENLQRKDVHPIEEAEGYQRLMDEYQYTADALAEKVGKSRSYIYGRLKFSALASAAREAFFDGKLNASTALLIARIPTETLQEHATTEIIEGHDGEPMSYRDAFEHIKTRYMLDLERARFSIKDAKLVPAAGACEDCPKRTGNQPMIFKDVDAHVCTDPNCFASKSRAHDDKILAKAEKKGIPVYEGKEATEFVKKSGLVNPSTPLYRFERRAEADFSQYTKPVGDLLDESKLPTPITYVRVEGKVVPMFEKTAMQDALERAGVCETEEQQRAREEEEENTPLSPEEEAAKAARLASEEREEALATAERETRIEAYRRAREAMKSGLTAEAWRVIIRELARENGVPSDALPDIYTWESYNEEETLAYAEKATAEELQLLIMDMLCTNPLYVHGGEVKDDGSFDVEDDGYQALISITSSAGIDIDDIRADHSLGAMLADQPPPPEEINIGDRIRINDDAKNASGKKHKLRGKEGTVREIMCDGTCVIQMGATMADHAAGIPMEYLTKLPAAATEDEPSGEEPPTTEASTKARRETKAKASEVKKTVLNPEAAWPFPTGVRP